MGVIRNPHDKFFKAAMSNLQVAKEFFEYHLPDSLRARLDFNTLELQPGTYINKALQGSESDVLYKVKLRGKSRSIYLYVLIEHQSSVDYLMPLRFLEYTASIWRSIIKKNVKRSQNKNFWLPLIVPLLFYNGRRKYNGSTDIREIIDAPQELIEAFCLKGVQLIDLNDIDDQALREKKWLEVVDLMMKHIHDREILNYVQYIVDVIKFVLSQGNTDLASSVLEYILDRGQTADPEHLEEVIKASLTEGNIMGTCKDLWVKEAEANLLISQLEYKFKTIPERYKRKIKQASSAVLLQLGKRILKSHSLEEIFSTHNCDTVI